MLECFRELTKGQLGEINRQRLVEPKGRPGHKPGDNADYDSDKGETDNFWSGSPLRQVV